MPVPGDPDVRTAGQAVPQGGSQPALGPPAVLQQGSTLTLGGLAGWSPLTHRRTGGPGLGMALWLSMEGSWAGDSTVVGIWAHTCQSGAEGDGMGGGQWESLQVGLSSS